MTGHSIPENSLPADIKATNAVSADIQEVPAILQIWHAIYNRKIPIFAIVSACVIAGIIATLIATPKYTSKSRVEISRNQENVTNVEGLQPDDRGQDLEFYQTQYALLEARSLATRVVNSLNLINDDSFFELFGESPDSEGFLGLQSTTQQTAENRLQRRKIASEILLDNISVSAIRGSKLVDISFTSPKPEFSAEVANAWVDQFIQSNLDRRFASTSDARDFLEKRLAQLKDKLETSETSLVGYANKNEIITLSTSKDSGGKTSTERTLTSADLEALNTALAETISQRIAAESEAAQRRGANKEALSNLAVNGIRQQRAIVASEYAKLLAQFEPDYPTAKALASQLKALDQSIADEEGRVRAGSNSKYRELLQKERTLRAKVDQTKRKFANQQRASIQYNIYQREVDTNRQLYEGLLQRYKEIGVAGVGSNNIAIVDKAEVSDSPSSPRLLWNLAIALLAGVGLSGMFVFALEQVDQSVKDPSDIKRHLNLSVLGIIPQISDDNILESLEDKKSIASESYLSVRTNLSFLTEFGVPKSLLLTSTQPNEGKTISSYAIAEVLARTGKRVVLIDSDMRNPSLHILLAGSNEKGLSSYLSGQSDYMTLISQTKNPNLHTISAGPTPPNAAELLSTDRMGGLIQELSKKFDHVIVDAPPVLGLADIPLLAGTVEGIIYTIEANGTKLRTIQSALQRLLAAKANVFGAIVTKLDSRNSSYGYGHGYGYGYDYGTEKTDR